MPDILKEKHWGCPEAVELNIWAAQLIKHRNMFADKEPNVGKPLESLFRSIADIRHTAVHRIPITARGIEQFLINSESLAALLGDNLRLEMLVKLRKNTQSTIEELQRNKQILISKLKEKLEKIAAKRAELNHLAEATVHEIEREDAEYQLFVGINLEQTMDYESPASTSATDTENRACSTADDSEDDAECENFSIAREQQEIEDFHRFE
ncbi:hypothetical protein B7463_g6771, partial [Scytalidium lignicola]